MKTKRLLTTIFAYIVLMFFTQQINDFWVKNFITSSLTVILLIIIAGVSYFMIQQKKNITKKKINFKNVLNINQNYFQK